MLKLQHRNTQINLDLKRFHNDLKSCGCNKAKRLALFKEYANKKYIYKKRMPVKKIREKFLKIRKFSGPLNRMVKFRHCGVCRNSSGSRHHIIQLQNGGDNRKKNLIGLCNDCHEEIHPWLQEDMRFADIS